MAVNLDPWSDEDRAELTLATEATDFTRTALTAADFDDEFPALLPAPVLRPHWFAILFMVVAVAVRQPQPRSRVTAESVQTHPCQGMAKVIVASTRGRLICFGISRIAVHVPDGG